MTSLPKSFVLNQAYASKMNTLRTRTVVALVASILFGALPAAMAGDDPFPNVAFQSEIPGTRISSPPGITQADWEASSTYTTWRTTHCAEGSGMGTEINLNFTTDRSDDVWSAYCIKTWQAAPIVAPSESSTVQVPSSPTPTETTTAPVNSETSTPVPTPTPSVTPTPTPVPQAGGFGGYAVVDPRDNHVCGVVVSASSDPFNNGGFMSQEYMGCPVGARFVFQTFPSESGNVAGWHGPDVILTGSTYSLPGGSTLTNGIVTDPNGRTWHSGTGATITPGRTTPAPPTVDSGTAPSESQTAQIPSTTPTPTAPVNNETTTSVTPTPVTPPLTQPESATVADDLDSLPEVIAEEEVNNTIEARIVSNKTRIEVSTEWVSTRLSVVATKKGSKKKYTYRFTTNSNGDYIFKSGVNLKGFTLRLLKGIDELDREIV
jgi:hypothetical protein